MQQAADERHTQRLRRRGVPPLVVNMAALETILRDRGWSVAQLAREMGMDRTSVHLTLCGRQNVGAEFQARLLAVCPRHRWSDLFTSTVSAAADTAGEGAA